MYVVLHCSFHLYSGWLVKHITFSYGYWSFGYPPLWIFCSIVLLIFLLGSLFLPYWFVGVLSICLVWVFHRYTKCFEGCLFPLLCLSTQKLSISIFSNLSIVFPLWLAIFASCLKNLCLLQGHRYFLLFSSESIIVLHLILRSTVYVELISCMVWGKGQNIFFPCGYPIYTG